MFLLAVVCQVYGQYIDEVVRRGITFTVDMMSQSVHVAISDFVLAEIFSALIDNALKYILDGGSICLATANDDDAGVVVIMIGDSGMGIIED